MVSEHCSLWVTACSVKLQEQSIPSLVFPWEACFPPRAGPICLIVLHRVRVVWAYSVSAESISPEPSLHWNSSSYLQNHGSESDKPPSICHGALKKPSGESILPSVWLSAFSLRFIRFLLKGQLDQLELTFLPDDVVFGVMVLADNLTCRAIDRHLSGYPSACRQVLMYSVELAPPQTSIQGQHWHQNWQRHLQEDLGNTSQLRKCYPDQHVSAVDHSSAFVLAAMRAQHGVTEI